MLKTCPVCGVEFKAERLRRVYCSFACNGKAKEGNPGGNAGRKKGPRVTCKCLGCGKDFEATPLEVEKGRGRYCGQECYHASRAGKSRGPYGPTKPPEEKTCEACGKKFLAGGRGMPNRKSRLCSVECQRAARRRRCESLCKTLSPTEAAYIAGIIDGEGSIMLIARTGQNGAHLRVSITNTHRGVLDWITVVSGIGRTYEVDNVKYGKSTKVANHWRTHGDAAQTLLQQLLPYLIIKRPQAEMGIEFQTRLGTPAMLADKAWQIEWMARMKAMNERGRRPLPSGG